MPVVTVLLADPVRVSRLRLSIKLRGCAIGDVVEASTVAEVNQMIGRGLTGEVALISLAFGVAAPRLIRDVHRAGWVAVLATGAATDPDPVIRAVRAGACGVLRGPPPVQPLTARDIQVLALVADGRSNIGIGARLSVSALTVKGLLARIGRKLGTGDRAEMVALAIRGGVIP